MAASSPPQLQLLPDHVYAALGRPLPPLRATNLQPLSYVSTAQLRPAAELASAAGFSAREKLVLLRRLHVAVLRDVRPRFKEVYSSRADDQRVPLAAVASLRNIWFLVRTSRTETSVAIEANETCLIAGVADQETAAPKVVSAAPRALERYTR